MFGNSYQNNAPKSANTKLYTMYSPLSALTIGLWDDKISIKLNPYESTDSNGIRKYDYNKKVNTAIMLDKSQALVRDFKNKIIPLIKEVENGGTLAAPVSVGFAVGQNKSSGVFLSYEPHVETGVPTVYLTVYTNIDENNNAGESMKFEFGKVELIENYFGKAEDTPTDKKIEGEIWIFLSLLEKHVDVLGITYHSDKWYSMMYVARQNYQNNNGNNFGGGDSGFTPSQNSNYKPEEFTSDDLPF